MLDLFKQDGFSLLEVLVAISILGICLLGLLSMCFYSLSRAEDCYCEDLASLQLISIIEMDPVGGVDYQKIQQEYKSFPCKIKVSIKSNILKSCWHGKLEIRCLTIDRIRGN